MSEIKEVDIRSLKFSSEDSWLDAWGKQKGHNITSHPIYLALKGNNKPLQNWCNARKDIWMMERMDLVMDVYKSLIRYGQIEPIEIDGNVIVTGHKRACCMLVMGKGKIKAEVK